ncbi:threonine-phosphate decarboxylase [Marinimicrobium sp. ABcell2]|uniref:threonine-phosphate decarboxylase n=1 Tax=Marinimicrobium sp. ABcell2 TaxID=3069751 RepID=UPI0027B4C721|nr:threonine-phosphate decarboxylase [Marinimicrobium sp. ABcell2]MDQ2076738.1 pyridoxal phosphate-dependent class II aminotransferase [Marinimicrobium sp. ABcell2]
MTQVDFPAHGGDLEYARRVFGEPATGWQDLSTGVSPWVYPVAEVPADVWQRLPGNNDDLCQAADDYYGVAANAVVPVPGSQVAIARIPHLVTPGRVAIPTLGYSGHSQAWRAAGHTVTTYSTFEELLLLLQREAVEHVVLVNPNNPTGERFGVDFIRQVCQALDGRGVVLLDEAFADAFPELSATDLLDEFPDLWILRSMGKFFGLAGLRLGFLLGQGELANQLSESLEPWGISHPAQWLGSRALRDRDWQHTQRLRIQAAEQALVQLWRDYLSGGFSVRSAGLFVTLQGDGKTLFDLYQALGQRGLFLRWCDWSDEAMGEHTQPWLRCGLPDDGGARLQQALAELACTQPDYTTTQAHTL